MRNKLRKISRDIEKSSEARKLRIHCKKRKMDIVHHLLVHLHRGTDVSSRIRFHRISELDLHSLKVVWHKDVMRVLHVLSVV